MNASKNPKPKRVKRRIQTRPSFRLTKVNAYALAAYKSATQRKTSATLNMALQLFLPPEYIAAAQQKLSRKKAA